VEHFHAVLSVTKMEQCHTKDSKKEYGTNDSKNRIIRMTETNNITLMTQQYHTNDSNRTHD